MHNRREAALRPRESFLVIGTFAAILLACAQLVRFDRASGVAYHVGDVFVGTGSGRIEHFSSSGVLLDTLSTGLTDHPDNDTGMAFDQNGNLYATDFDSQAVSKFDNSGNLLGTFGSGYASWPESIVFDLSQNAYVGQAGPGSDQVLKFDPSGNLMATFSPQVEDRGTDWIDLKADQCTLFYTSEGYLVKRFDVCTNSQLADFAILPKASTYALKIRPDGEVLVADSAAVYDLDAQGNVLHTYTFSGETKDLFGLSLDPDGASFWTAGYASGNVYKVNIGSGVVETKFNAGTSNLFGLVVYGEIAVAQPTATATPTGGALATATPTPTPPGGGTATPLPTCTPTVTVTPTAAPTKQPGLIVYLPLVENRTAHVTGCDAATIHLPFVPRGAVGQ